MKLVAIFVALAFAAGASAQDIDASAQYVELRFQLQSPHHKAEPATAIVREGANASLRLDQPDKPGLRLDYVVSKIFTDDKARKLALIKMKLYETSANGTLLLGEPEVMFDLNGDGAAVQVSEPDGSGTRFSVSVDGEIVTAATLKSRLGGMPSS